MPRNVEIKAFVQDVTYLKSIASKLSESQPTILKQRDTFFNVDKGRLKLREINDENAQLIYYDRPDESGPKLSTFHFCPVADAPGLLNVLSLSNGIRGVISKTRYLYMIGQTRVHVDEVYNLGNFMELEVMLRDEQSVEDGESIAYKLMAQLGIEKDDLLTGAYIDMILNKNKCDVNAS